MHMVPTRIGQHTNGGTFTGIIRNKQHCYAIICNPHPGMADLPLKSRGLDTFSTVSNTDGWANCNSICNSITHSPAITWCKRLTTNNYNDWYLPSRDELELCYRYLKPSQYPSWEGRLDNNLFFPHDAGSDDNLRKYNGENPNSIPTGKPYSDTHPTKTISLPFITHSKLAFKLKAYYWTSTRYITQLDCALAQTFFTGYQAKFSMQNTGDLLTRAVRRDLLV